MRGISNKSEAGLARVNFEFKATLDSVIGGATHSLCYQCGACVGDCPAAEYSERFNPRQIMLDAVLGLSERLICADSVVWECTCCTNCFEHCPQDVRPIDVIMAIKNINHQAGFSPDHVAATLSSVGATGRTIAISDLINKRRRELGLPELADPPTDELQKILNGKQR